MRPGTVDISKKTQSEEKESDLLCGDTLTNFKTVQSFGNEEQIFKLYKKFLDPVFSTNIKQHIKIGAALAFNQQM